MARAVLEIAADTSGIEAAFGRLRTESQRLEQQMRAVFAGVAQQGTRAFRDSARTQAAEARRGAQASEREAQRAVLAFVRGEEQKRRAARMTVANQERAERQATELAAQEARKRGLTAEQEARVRTTALQRFTREFEREERRQTQIAQQHARERERDGRTVAHGIRRGMNVGGDAAMNVARESHSQMQDARRQRAESEHTLNAAFYQAGVAGPEAAQMQSTLRTALASGPLRGLSMEDVAQGIMGAQTQFSVLTGANAAERSANFQRQLELAAFARNTFQDPAEVMRVAGMLQQQGVTGADQMSTIMSMTGMAHGGSIELADVTRQAMGPLMQNIARSVNAGMSAPERSRAVQAATLETLAVGEITSRAAPNSVRDHLVALSKTRASIANERTQEALFARLRTSGGAEGQALASQMFTVQNGRARLREGTSAVGFLSQLVAGFGGDVNRVSNLVAPGGHGAPMTLDSQQRRLLLLLSSQGRGGETIAQNVAAMQQQGASFSQADVARGRATRDAEQLTNLESSEQARLNALTDNTSEVVKLSNRFADFVARNPITSSVLQTGGGLLGGLLGGAFVNRAGRALAGNSTIARAVQFLSGTPAAVAEGASGAASTIATSVRGAAPAIARAAPTIARTANPVGLLTTLLSFGGAFSGTDFQQSQRRSLEGFVAGAAPDRQAITRRAGESLIQQGQPITAESIGRAVAQALRENPPTATVSPTDAQHAATQAAPAAGRR